jgi:hypothetical protein
MKSKQLVPIFFIAVLLGCSKSKNADPTEEKTLKIKIESVIASTSSEERIQMFNLLTAEEKYVLWKDHFQKAKAQFTASGHTQKISLIDDLLLNFTSSVFDDNSQAGDVFLNYFVPIWNNLAETAFTSQELYDISFNPAAVVIGNLVVQPEDDDNPSPTAGCFCHAGTSGFSCRKVIVSIPPSIQNGICERSNADCTEKRRGCGWFWLSTCDGNHCQF